ncbi:polyprenyl synthetase family protein [Jiella pelagia]|uniref:polyprenyl synthetase family protein n=1 Tax=Jiella pelagia TaxID=2986949 RepID=UPI002E373E53|nr:polyprenyl synthetase family protein [Jiella pelagia]
MTPELLSGLARQRDLIDRRLRFLVPRALPGQTALDEAVAASVLAPGKRLRPMMTVMVAMDLGGDVETAVDAGCAVEMVHAASLTLDDLPAMDDATMRRGRPAVHAAYGEDIAILASIAALSGAFETLAKLSGASDQARAESVAILARAVGVSGLVAGQFADLREGAHARDVTDIAVTNSLKTGSLFSAAVEIGAVVSGAGHAARLELRRFATEARPCLPASRRPARPSRQCRPHRQGRRQGRRQVDHRLGHRPGVRPRPDRRACCRRAPPSRRIRRGEELDAWLRRLHL